MCVGDQREGWRGSIDNATTSCDTAMRYAEQRRFMVERATAGVFLGSGGHQVSIRMRSMSGFRLAEAHAHVQPALFLIDPQCMRVYHA